MNRQGRRLSLREKPRQNQVCKPPQNPSVFMAIGAHIHGWRVKCGAIESDMPPTDHYQEDRQSISD